MAHYHDNSAWVDGGQYNFLNPDAHCDTPKRCLQPQFGHPRELHDHRQHDQPSTNHVPQYLVVSEVQDRSSLKGSDYSHAYRLNHKGMLLLNEQLLVCDRWKLLVWLLQCLLDQCANNYR